MTRPIYEWLGFKTENDMINDAGVQFYEKPALDFHDNTVVSGNIAPMVFTEDKLGKLFSRKIVSESDPSGRPLNTPGAKADAGKIKPYLMLAGFARALELVAEVTTKGAEKYTPNGWAEVPDGVERYMEGFGRHLLKLGQGEIYDNGQNGIGTKHKAQMIWNLLASLELEEREKGSS